jgi:hypothetical protein
MIGLTFVANRSDDTGHNEKQELRPCHRQQSGGGEPTPGD